MTAGMFNFRTALFTTHIFFLIESGFIFICKKNVKICICICTSLAPHTKKNIAEICSKLPKYADARYSVVVVLKKELSSMQKWTMMTKFSVLSIVLLHTFIFSSLQIFVGIQFIYQIKQVIDTYYRGVETRVGNSTSRLRIECNLFSKDVTFILGKLKNILEIPKQLKYA